MDKKLIVVNWIDGCGKFVVCEVILKGDVVCKVLKIFVFVLVELNMVKNLVGFVLVGVVGGFNVYVVNIVFVIYIVIG